MASWLRSVPALMGNLWGQVTNVQQIEIRISLISKSDPELYYFHRPNTDNDNEEAECFALVFGFVAAFREPAPW